MRLNEIISHFHEGHSWLELPFEDQKSILVKWNKLPILERWDFRIADNPNKELHLALEVTSLFLRGMHTLLNQIKEADEKGDSIFLLEISKKLKLHFSYVQGYHVLPQNKPRFNIF